MDPLTPAFRGLLLSAIIILIGVPATLLFVVYPQAKKDRIGTRVIDRITVFLVASSLLTVSLSTIGLTLLDGGEQWSLSERLLHQFLSSDLGRVSLVEMSVGLVLGTTTAVEVSERQYVSKRDWLRTVAAGGLVMLVAFCLVSYSPTIPDGRVAILLKIGHLTGVALWTGGLLVLTMLVPRLLTRAEGIDVDELAADVIRRFSPIATVGVSLAGATGFAIAAWHVPSSGAVHASRYGLALVGKVALFVLAATLGGLNRVLLLHRLESSTGGLTETIAEKIPDPFSLGIGHDSPGQNTAGLFVRMVRIEFGVLVAVIVVSVILQSLLTVPQVAPDAGTSSSGLQRALQLVAIALATIGVATIAYEVRSRTTT